MDNVKVFTKKQLELLGLNVNEFVEVKQKLTYLSWASAWKEFIKVFPEATYDIIVDEQTGLPYFGTPKMGYMVRTWVMVEGVKRFMWLPVLDMKFKVLKDEPYEYTTKYGTSSVDTINMFDVNKALMRCLTKNLAMFGLGLYIYRGEDLPEEVEPNRPKPKETQTPSSVTAPPPRVEPNSIRANQIKQIHTLLNITKSDKIALYEMFNAKSSKDLSEIDAIEVISMLKLKEKSMKKKGLIS